MISSRSNCKLYFVSVACIDLINPYYMCDLGFAVINNPSCLGQKGLFLVATVTILASYDSGPQKKETIDSDICEMQQPGDSIIT